MNFTCPMHPEIRQAEPGTCPICGMSLEAEHAAPNKELWAMRLRFWICLCFTLPIIAFSNNWIQAACATPVVLWGGFPFFVGAHRSLNMFTLIAHRIIEYMQSQGHRVAMAGDGINDAPA